MNKRDSTKNLIKKLIEGGSDLGEESLQERLQKQRLRDNTIASSEQTEQKRRKNPDSYLLIPKSIEGNGQELINYFPKYMGGSQRWKQ